jgi:hypothetical protein
MKRTPYGMTHSDIINLWPSLSEFAGDIGVEYGTAKAMRRRSSIPVEYWPKVIGKAAERSIDGITPESMLKAVAEVAA